MWLRTRDAVRKIAGETSGVAAVEFSVIVPIMLVMFFGMVEFSTGVAVDRKLTLVARTLSDLTSQSTAVNDVDLGNFGQAAKAILTPYSATTFQAAITELYVDPATHKAKAQWSKGLTIDAGGNVVLGPSNHSQGDVIVIPPALTVDGTYLILSEVKYTYTPAVGYVMAKAGINLSDLTYTRPRQSACVKYNTTTCTTF
jgi:Flp pilus assembly protein TadG